MNIEAFSDDNFSAVEWINATYKNCEQSSKDEFVSSLVTKLQLYHQQVNAALEETSQQVLTVLPRIMKDTNNLQNDVVLLQGKMKEVQLEIGKVQNDTGNCMSNLERLDSLKEKLLIAKNGLQESDGWGKLVSELEDLFERNDLWKICEKLQSLQKSLAAQEKLPGQNDRLSQVEGFKNRLEALASPSVVQCFATGDIEQTKKYVTIFTNMDRMPQFRQYYKTVQKTTLQQHWNEVLNLSENSNRFLNDFYEFLVERIQKQTKWYFLVFGPEGPNEPINILIELLPSLKPSRESVVLESLKRSNEKLDVLQEFSNSNVHLAKLFEKQLNLTAQNKITTDQFQNIRSSIFDYFNTFITQYPTIEQNHLATSLVNLNLNQTTTIEAIRALGTANKKILEWAEDSMKRCDNITQNIAISPLTTVLNSIFQNYIEKYKKAQQQISASRKIEQNWSLLQTSISLLQNLGDFSNGLRKFEMKMSEKITETNQKINNSNDIKYFGYCLFEKRDINEIKKLANKIENDQQKILIDSDKNYGIFVSVFNRIKLICEEIHDATLSVIFAPIEKYLQNIEPTENFNSSGADLPDYSYAPQEWLTQIGQYLLTLPQHLEPLLLSPSPSLKSALEVCDKKYKENIPSADVLLSLVVEESCTLYQNQILQMKSLNTIEAKQLATDIEYLGNVLEELGLTVTTHLQQTATLLRASPENYLSMSSGCEPRLVTAIRQMRNIISSA